MQEFPEISRKFAKYDGGGPSPSRSFTDRRNAQIEAGRLTISQGTSFAFLIADVRFFMAERT
jgi:hypothetical protein